MRMSKLHSQGKNNTTTLLRGRFTAMNDCGYSEELKTSEVFFCPTGLVTNHPLKQAKREGLTWAVEGDRYPSSFMMAEALMPPSAIS